MTQVYIQRETGDPPPCPPDQMRCKARQTATGRKKRAREDAADEKKKKETAEVEEEQQRVEEKARRKKREAEQKRWKHEKKGKRTTNGGTEYLLGCTYTPVRYTRAGPAVLRPGVRWIYLSIYLSRSICLSSYLSVWLYLSIYLGLSLCVSINLAVSVCLYSEREMCLLLVLPS